MPPSHTLNDADPTPADDESAWQPVYFAFSLAEAEYIISYLDSSAIDADAEPDEEHPGCHWVLVLGPDVHKALQVLAQEREGKLDEKGIEAIRTAMGFSGGQLAVIALWSIVLLTIVVAAAFFIRH